MAVSLINNVGSLDSQQRLATNASKLNNTIQRLSSGLRINSSGDDAAGLAIANKFRSDISQLRQGIRNANDGVSTLQIVDGGLNTISNLLDRAAVLATQSASDTFSGDRNTLNSELTKVTAEISRQAQNIGLADGSTDANFGRFNKALSVFIGGGTSAQAANNTVSVDLSGASSRVDAAGLKLDKIDISQAQGGPLVGTTVAAKVAASPGTPAVPASNARTGTTAVPASFTGTTTYVVDGVNVALDGSSTAMSRTDVVAAFNTALSSRNITASLDTSNNLVLSRAQGANTNAQTQFAITNSGTDSFGLVGNSTVNAGSPAVPPTPASGGLTAAETLSISVVGRQTPVSVSLAQGASASDMVTAINSALTTAGVTGITASTDAANATAAGKVTLTATGDTIFKVSSNAAAGAAGQSGLKGGNIGAKDALQAIRTALDTLGTVQGKVGAGQNNLAQAIDLATTQVTNFQAAESRLRDADVAAEASDLARLSTLQQAGVSALAQANQSSQAVLSLLR